MIMLLLFVIGAAGVGGYLYVKMKGVKPASKKNQPDPDTDYHDEDEDALQLPEDDGDRTKKWMSTRITKQNRTMNLSD